MHHSFTPGRTFCEGFYCTAPHPLYLPVIMWLELKYLLKVWNRWKAGNDRWQAARYASRTSLLIADSWQVFMWMLKLSCLQCFCGAPNAHAHAFDIMSGCVWVLALDRIAQVCLVVPPPFLFYDWKRKCVTVMLPWYSRITWRGRARQNQYCSLSSEAKRCVSSKLGFWIHTCVWLTQQETRQPIALGSS